MVDVFFYQVSCDLCIVSLVFGLTLSHQIKQDMAPCQFLRLGLLHVEPENHQFHGLEWVQKEVVSYWNLLNVLRLGIKSDFK
jgi:hypothetical protein